MLKINTKKTYQTIGAISLIILLIPQVNHTVFVFESNSNHQNAWFAWCYAIGIDLAILIFTLKGWTWTAVGYLIATFLTNMVYQFYPIGPEAKVLLSVLLSATIFIFSHLYKEEQEEVEHSSQENRILSKARELGISIELNPYKCPCCGKSFPSKKELNGHISGHKSKKEWVPESYGDWEKHNEQRAKFTNENKEGIEKTLSAA